MELDDIIRGDDVSYDITVEEKYLQRLKEKLISISQYRKALFH